MTGGVRQRNWCGDGSTSATVVMVETKQMTKVIKEMTTVLMTQWRTWVMMKNDQRVYEVV